MIEIRCPFCEEGYAIEADDYADGVAYDFECEECGKLFLVRVDISISATVTKPEELRGT